MLLEKERQTLRKERALLVGVRFGSANQWEIEDHLAELGRLVNTAGGEVVFSTIQKRHKPEAGTFIGRGKIESLTQLIEDLEIDTVVFDDALTPAQQRNLSNAFNRKVIDREGLILDIFAQRALTREGKLQVMLAQYEYMLPRLTRMWTHLDRAGGGIGTRGPGETQLETDRRLIQNQIAKLKKELKKVANRRELHRANRKRTNIPVVALVGYTNAGKSTLLNMLSGADVFAEDKLFATLDPVVRKVHLAEGVSILASDTVGFIRKLPHQLVSAFKSTLEEVREADVILHVIDASFPHWQEQEYVVLQVLKDLKVENVPMIRVFNKADRLEEVPQTYEDEVDVFISALKGQSIDELRRRIAYQLNFVGKQVPIPAPDDDAQSDFAQKLMES